MFFDDHPPPHFHAKYGDHQAQIDIATGDVLHGFLPRRALNLVQEWTELHRDELADDWERGAGGTAGKHRTTAMTAPYEITAVEHLDGYRLRLSFADGVVADVDLSERIQAATGPVFEPLKDVEYFAKVTADPELGTVVWPNGADLAPDVLHEQALSLT